MRIKNLRDTMNLDEYINLQCVLRGKKRSSVIEDLAKFSGVSIGCVYHWVNGKREPSIKNVGLIMQYTNGLVKATQIRKELNQIL
jgi:transcriptional regulator with XRE-family HTH domain